MADVLQRADHPGVAPRKVVFRHPDDQVPDLREHAKTTTAPLCDCSFARYQPPMPAKNRVRRHNGGDSTQAAPAQLMSAYRQPPAFLIGQADPAAPMPTKNAVLFEPVGHLVLMPLAKPTLRRHMDCVEHCKKS
jgi:hypothetical protein